MTKHQTRFIVDVYRDEMTQEDIENGTVPCDEENLKADIIDAWGFTNPDDVQVKLASTWNDMDTLPAVNGERYLILSNPYDAEPVGSQGFSMYIVYYSEETGSYRLDYDDRIITHSNKPAGPFALCWTYAPPIPKKYQP